MLPNPATHSPSPRRWPRFRLRTLLVFTTFACVLLAWIVRQRRQSAWEMGFAETLEARGDIALACGPYDYCDVLSGDMLSDQTWWQRGAQSILGPRVYGVWFLKEVAAVTDLSTLADLPYLKRLQISDSNLPDLRPLGELTKLEYIYLQMASVSDLAPFARLPKLRGLRLDYFVGDDLGPLGRLARLEQLVINCQNVRDLTPLKALSNLEWLEIHGRSITEAERNELQTALPHCHIAN